MNGEKKSGEMEIMNAETPITKSGDVISNE
jgi:hypothetical protein